MADVIAGLENINNFWEKRVVYGLREGNSGKSDYDAVIINIPLVKYRGGWCFGYKISSGNKSWIWLHKILF